MSRNSFLFYYLRSTLWLVPFLCFVTGYLITAWLVRPDSIVVPDLIGLSLDQAFKKMPAQLPLCISDTVEEVTVPAGTILSQRPAPKSTSKRYQPVRVVVTCLPEPRPTPCLTNNTISTVPEMLESAGLRSACYYISSNYPAQRVIAQDPAPGLPVPHDKLVTIYSAASDTTPRICPLLKGCTLAQVKEFIARYPTITLAVVTTGSNNSSGLTKLTLTDDQTGDQSDDNDNHWHVIAQKPLAGSFVDISKPLTITVSVKHD